MKSFQRLDYERLAEALKERQLVDSEALRLALHQCLSTGAPLTNLLVEQGLVADWELCRLCCELFHLPFLPLTNYEADQELFKEFDVELLRQYSLVPMDRFGKLITMAMPGMVPTDVLQTIEEENDVKVLPVVSSVQSNLAWIDQHLPAPDLEGFSQAADESGWSNVLDLADQAVAEELVATDLDNSPALDETAFHEVIDFDGPPEGAIQLDQIEGALPTPSSPEPEEDAEASDDLLDLNEDPPSLRLSLRRPPSTES